MKTVFKILLTSVVLVFSACKAKTNTTARILRSDKPFSISLERTPCFGTCPVYKVEIHSDGRIEYNGKEFSNPKGDYETFIPLDEVELIRRAIVESRFLNLEDIYDNVYISDLPSAITTLTVNGKQIKTVKNRYNPPPQLVKLEVFIDSLWRKELEAKE